ncbi:malate synthase G [Acinetobacter sp. B10A]|uniref:malate synthase G n=1 Tax=Acinetobacter baretiae TaxID=2605383 RepID=UPI001B3C6583|nr:malate synthase G [Acinetobacter baretiae]MBF7684534.1 malate synthase G [Acinetobacter baretiae]
MTQRVQIGDLAIDQILFDFIENEALPVAKLNSSTYWSEFEKIVKAFTARNKQLLQHRQTLQSEITRWHKEHSFDVEVYKQFLYDIDYLTPDIEDFKITTDSVDDEIATIAGPQLVVPVRNARYSLNAANARWGSLYDALYGFNLISEKEGAEKTTSYNPIRGQKVISFAKQFLDENFALEHGSHSNAVKYHIEENTLWITLTDGQVTTLVNRALFVGFNGEKLAPTELVFQHHQLHVMIQFDGSHFIGRIDQAKIKDIILESAVTTIQDLEDSVAAVDAEEKVEGYRNWLGLMQGTLTDRFEKNGQMLTRTLHPDRHYQTTTGQTITLHGRSMMLLRHVGHLMTNPAVLIHGEEIFEGILDILITPLLSKIDILGQNTLRNSRTGSMYIVKPKMHGPEEVKFAVDLFEKAEQLVELPHKSLKIGIMDEERRTSVNLKACIAAAKDRIIFINTGFMDRTGDEIHTFMVAGPMVRKADIKQQKWFAAYENRNVAIGLACGLQGKAQIGKGMWPKPDQLLEMYQSKIEHPQAGASCAWVPSPSGAVIHAMHYHQCHVVEQQNKQLKQDMLSLNDLLTPPLATQIHWTTEEINQELENNCQGILGYVVRWVDLGMGCSKVPDIHHVGLMEDRATLRISSQHIANWLHHGIVTASQVRETLVRMAKIVDQQNANDPKYKAMSDNLSHNLAFQAASDLIFKGELQPSGYTEPLLHAARLKLKGYCVSE